MFEAVDMIYKATIFGKKMGIFDKVVNDSCSTEAPRVTVKKSDIITCFMMGLILAFYR